MSRAARPTSMTRRARPRAASATFVANARSLASPVWRWRLKKNSVTPQLPQHCEMLFQNPAERSGTLMSAVAVVNWSTQVRYDGWPVLMASRWKRRAVPAGPWHQLR